MDSLKQFFAQWSWLMPALLVIACLIAIIVAYFRNNPLKHERWFLVRRFINWFPLGMTYAFFYMGRYNLNVCMTALGKKDDKPWMDNGDFGNIFAAGTVVYAFSFLLNGPLVDKIGGKKGILIGGLGSSVANILLGFLTYLMLAGKVQLVSGEGASVLKSTSMVLGGVRINLLVAFCILYGLNMFFQSYGAVSIIKVKAYWFHVRERGIFGAIFGTLISFGIFFAFDLGQGVIDVTKHGVEGGWWLPSLLRAAFVPAGTTIDATWAVFFVPAIVMTFWVILDVLCIKDTPEEAGFPHLETHDASSGQMHIELSTMDLLRKVFLSPLMLMAAAIELTSGVLRNGVYNWYKILCKGSPEMGSVFITKNWGLLLCVFGIVGGFAGGMISDKFFQSRRAPPVVMFCGFMFVMTILMAVGLKMSPLLLGWSAIMISMAVIGVHSLMSGTAAADFGGRKATATCSGIVDGFVYLGSGLQSLCLGYLTKFSWMWWPIFLMPFALMGMGVAMSMWRSLPDATRKYLQEVENKTV